jgi:hypothetical protein
MHRITIQITKGGEGAIIETLREDVLDVPQLERDVAGCVMAGVVRAVRKALLFAREIGGESADLHYSVARSAQPAAEKTDAAKTEAAASEICAHMHHAMQTYCGYCGVRSKSSCASCQIDKAKKAWLH